jgi:uncharacterized delta-60 repeat protein
MASMVFITTVGAQTVNETFNLPLPIRPAKVQCIKVLDDGKLLLGGDIEFVETRRVNNLIRLNSDNTIDTTFNFTGNKELLIIKIEVLTNGDIIVLSHGFKSYINQLKPNSSLFRLGPDGEIKYEIDTLMNPSSIAIQNDNKILVCGGNESASPPAFLYRLNSDFTPDSTFNNNISFDHMVTDVKVDNNKLIVSGMFSTVNDTIKNDIVRLNMDGTIDTTFDTGTGTNDCIRTLSVQSDGKILIGNSFINSFNGKLFHGMARLNPDGSVDNGFTPPL